MPSTHTNLLYHIVFSTKCRLPLIAPNIQNELYRYIGGIIHNEDGVPLEISGTNDHIHLLAKIKPAISISEMLARIKSNSSKWVNETKMKLRKFGWQEGYGAFSVSESRIPSVAKYIRGQEEHHRKQSFQEEYIELLRRHRIKYDEQYLWD
jgi:putative transposase